MGKAEEFRKRQQKINNEINVIENQMKTQIEETQRVGSIAANASQIIDDLDRQFEKQTGLNGVDVQFLFLATFLQIVRWLCIDNSKLRITASEGDKFVKRVVPKSWDSILQSSVPYDAVGNISDLETGLSGITHRYRTLGHDPVLGWVFGPVNILSDSLTKSDVITTYSVRDMKVVGMYPGSTIGAFYNAIESAIADKYNLPAAVLKQALHFSSDAFTKQGLPIPFISTLEPDLAKNLMLKFNVDAYSTIRGTVMALLINKIIAYIHLLFFDGNSKCDLDLYEVKTRKVLTYSNVLASSANIIYVATTKDYKKLDAGGILVTLYRLFNDINFIRRLKREFIYGEFEKMVGGNSYGMEK